MGGSQELVEEWEWVCVYEYEQGEAYGRGRRHGEHVQVECREHKHIECGTARRTNWMPHATVSTTGSARDVTS